MVKVCTNTLKAMILPLTVFLFFTIIAAPRFGIHSLRVVALQSILPTLIGFGLYQFMQAGMLDLTAGSQIILSAYVGGILSESYGILGLIVGCVIGGIILGIVSGAVYTALNIPSLVVSMGLIMVYEILASFLGAGVFFSIPRAIAVIGKPPYSVIIAIITLGLFFIVNYRTKYAIRLRAIGVKEGLAETLGIKTRRLKFVIYIIAGLFYGITSLLYISYSGSIGASYALDSIMMIFQPLMGVLIAMELRALINIGIGIFIGEFSLAVIFSGLIAMGATDTVQKLIMGLFLLVVISISTNKKKLIRFVHNIKRRKISA